MSNKVYDICKYIVQLLLPALATLYAALAAVWGLPYTEEVVQTVTAIVTFLSAVLGITNAAYYKHTAKNADNDIWAPAIGYTGGDTK